MARLTTSSPGPDPEPDPEPDPRPNLVEAFRNNPFDLAGLAPWGELNGELKKSLRELRQLASGNGQPPRVDDPHASQRHARILLGMLWAAQRDYARDGKAAFWRFFEDHLAESMEEPSQRRHFEGVWKQNRKLIGTAFQNALAHFGYFYPDEEDNDGWKYLTPLLMHAGLPKASLDGFLDLIWRVCQEFDEDAENLPSELIREHALNSSLHTNVRRIFEWGFSGSTQLFSVLVRTILDWQADRESAEQTLSTLPVQLERESFVTFLNQQSEADGNGASRHRRALPKLRFDPGDGSVRLWLREGRGEDWRITDGNNQPLRVLWEQGRQLVAEFLTPLPAKIVVSPRQPEFGSKITLLPYPADGRSLWFNAQSRLLTEGRSIDSGGLVATRWIVLLKGEPKFSPDESWHALPLKWRHFAGGGDWTAWEVEVPLWLPQKEHWIVPVSGESLSWRLSRQAIPKMEWQTERAAWGTLSNGTVVETFCEPPVLSTQHPEALSVRLLRRTLRGLREYKRLQLPPQSGVELPTPEPGVYELREASGLGRLLQSYAVVPGFSCETAEVGEDEARVRLSLAPNAGAFQADADSGTLRQLTDSSWSVTGNRVRPWLAAFWQVTEADETANCPPVRLSWPVRGLRWRIPGLTDWTDQTCFVEPEKIQEADLRVEIHTPREGELWLNGQRVDVKAFPPLGGVHVTDLMPYQNEPGLRMEWGDRERILVEFVRRPVLKTHLIRVPDQHALAFRWQARRLTPGAHVLAWDPLRPVATLRRFPLTAVEQESESWSRPWTEFAEWNAVAVTLAEVGGFGFRQTAKLAVVEAGEGRPREPYILLTRPSGAAGEISTAILQSCLNTVETLAFDRDEDVGAYREWFDQDEPPEPPILESVRTFAQELQQAAEANHLLLQGTPATAVGTELLELVNLWSRPAYEEPKDYFLALQFLVSKPPWPEDSLDSRRKKARLVWEFHREWDLPDPMRFVPLGSRRLFAQAYKFRDFTLPGTGVDRFLKALGLDGDITITAQEDQGRSAGQYTLRWSMARGEWTVTAWGSRRTCCLSLIMLDVPRADCLNGWRDFAEFWNRWSEPDSDWSHDLLDQRIATLVETFLPAQLVEVFRQGAGIAPSAKPIPPLFQTAWIWAWASRLRDRRDKRSQFNNRWKALPSNDRAAWKERETLLCRRHPQLATRVIALAELLHWTFTRKGLGQAARWT